MRKGLLVLGYVAAVIVIIVYNEPIVEWLHDGNRSEHFMLIVGAAIVFAFIPAVPYGVVAGVIGAKYGSALGGFINILSSTIAAALQFLLVRFVFQEQGIRLLSKSDRISRFTALMERNAFFAVLLARLVPFVPAVLVNVYTAVSRMRFGIFVAATLIGKIPVMFVFAVVGDQWLNDFGNVLWISLIYIVFLLLVFLVYRSLKTRQNNNAD